MPLEGKTSLSQEITCGTPQSRKLLGYSAAMTTLQHQILRVAATDASVFIVGESGSGKELVAQEIHMQSKRKEDIFLAVNCGAISPHLIESELFGHEKGSFTSADRLHKGYFERASKGTLFLDEILEMPMTSQVKLLRVLETKNFSRIGGHHVLHSDARIIVATNQDPLQAIVEGRFRLDLYHRLNVLPIHIPALRDRKEDIELLARHFLDEYNQLHQTKKMISTEMISKLRKYSWPGNVRELRYFIQRACILSNDMLELSLPTKSLEAVIENRQLIDIQVGMTVAQANQRLIVATLVFCGGAKKQAAKLLGISLKSLYNRLEEYSQCEKSETSSGIKPMQYETLLVGVNHAKKFNDYADDCVDPQLFGMRKLG
jgi:DNA-binding NtrC family response regulator